MKKKLFLKGWSDWQGIPPLIARAMRITCVLTFACVVNLYARGYSQEAQLTMNLRDVKLSRVFDVIGQQTDYQFLYNVEDVERAPAVTVEVKDATVPEILRRCFLNYPLSYRIVNKTVVVLPGLVLPSSLAMSMKAVSPPFEVRGRVSNSDGVPLVGVSIGLKGSETGAVTDGRGDFSLELPDGSGTLVLSYVGYLTREIPVNGRHEINVTLRPSVSSLNQLVVVGYGTQSRKNLTSSITTLEPKDLNKGPISDVGQLLEGKVPGLNITSSGDPNRPAAVILRGPSTLNSSETPFYVIDGIPGADITSVAPEDIASISILKDAAATAIYGNRASNGVIMITTKKGKAGQMHVSYSGYVGVEKVSNKLDMMNSSQLRSFLAKNNLSFSPADDKNANTNWQTQVERPSAVSFNHNLSFSGGGDHGNYMASINYFNRQGIIRTSSLQRFIAHLNVEQNALNDKVKFNLNITNSQSDADDVPLRNLVLLQMINHLPVSPVKNPDGSYFENFITQNYYNPVSMLHHAQDNTKYNNLRGIFTVGVTLPFGLTYHLNISYQNYTTLHGEYYDSYFTKNYNNIYNNPDPPATHALVNFGSNGYAVRSTYQNTAKTLETFFDWNRTFGDHHIDAVLGYSWQETVNGDGFQASSSNFPVDNIGYNNFALSNPYALASFRVDFGGDGIYQKSRLISDFFRVNYNYKDRYLLQGSLRRDGSSVFGANNQWGYFPSVGAGWRVGQESFMQQQKLFSDLKLRASYGITGNSTGFNPYTAQFISGSAGTFYYNGVQTAAYGPSQAANPDLRWEKTATTDVGLDFGLFDGMVTGTFDWYNKKTTGMIYSYAVDPILVPTGSIIANGGSMSNKGIELDVNVTPVKNLNFSWTTGLNIAHNKNEILSLSNPLFQGGDSVTLTQPDGGGQTGSTLQILKAGKPLGQFFTLQYAGKDPNGVSQYMGASGKLLTSPAIGVDYHYLGSPQPKVLVGWMNDFRYKRFDLNIFLRAVMGNKIFNVTRADLFRPTTAQYTNILVDVGGESTGDVNSYKYSSRFIENGSYVRLANATLGYTFPRIGKYVTNLRVYLTGNNLLIITGYKGIDPEINQGGIAPGIDSNNFYPKTRSVLFGVNVSF